VSDPVKKKLKRLREEVRKLKGELAYERGQTTIAYAWQMRFRKLISEAIR
jgi:hypothetical protein